MASIDLTRPKRRPAHTGRRPLFSAKPPMRWAAALGVLACVLVSGLAVHGGGEDPSSSDKFLTQALGEKRPGAPLVKRPAPGVRVRLDSSGFRVSRKQTQIGISLAGAKRGNWERFADGVSRPTAYGRRRSSSTRPAPSSSSPSSAGRARATGSGNSTPTRTRGSSPTARSSTARGSLALRRSPSSTPAARTSPPTACAGRSASRTARGDSAYGSTTRTFRSRISSTRRWTTPLRSISRARPRPRRAPGS